MLKNTQLWPEKVKLESIVSWAIRTPFLTVISIQFKKPDNSLSLLFYALLLVDLLTSVFLPKSFQNNSNPYGCFHSHFSRKSGFHHPAERRMEDKVCNIILALPSTNHQPPAGAVFTVALLDRRRHGALLPPATAKK